MCGFTGMAGTVGRNGMADAEAVLGRMTDALVHRGPDDRGLWLDPQGAYGVGFRRLSIVDLSPEGHQPMRSASGRFVIAFNGEVYNHRALRSELEGLGRTFRGHSDTEVILAAIETWGLRDSLRRFWGMLAFALWDTQERKLFLARDRVGKKPLYYGWQGNTFLFGSELKALREHPAFQADIDRGALALHLRYNCIPGEHSIFQGIHKLKPGSFLEVRPDRPGELGAPEPYWDARQMAERGQSERFRGSETEAVDHLAELLGDAVALRMEADVPVGAFLSGGVDSSLVVALMQQKGTRAAKTFSIGFQDEYFNEAHYAAAVAAHLGTDHTELYVSPGEAMAVIPDMPRIFDEPFSDSSQIPTYLVSRLARQKVIVALSGDGGDEVFGGYNRYHVGARLIRKVRHIPKPLCDLASRTILSVSPGAWDAGLGTLNKVLPRRLRGMVTGGKLHKLAPMLAMRDLEQFYLRAVSHWDHPDRVVLGAMEPPSLATSPGDWPALDSDEHRMMYLDLVSYLVDDILVKVDRASMSVSLEARAPLLDHRVIEFAWTLPLSMKIQGRQGKRIMRTLLDRHVPRTLIDRPKHGFGVPLGDWLRGPMADWAESLLDEGRLRREGFFAPEPVREMWRQHRSGARNHAHHLWDILMFQGWLEAQR